MDKDFTDGADDLLDKISTTLYQTPGAKSTYRIAGLRPIAEKSYLSFKAEVKCCSSWGGANCDQGKITL